MKVKVAQSCLTLCDPMDCFKILQAKILERVPISFSRESSQPRDQSQVYPYCRRILYQLSHKGSPRILEWEAYPFSSGSSQLRSQTRVSCVAGRFFTKWATRKPLSEVAQSCSTLCDPMDCSPPGSSVHGILQARIPELAVVPLSRGSSQPRDWTLCTAGSQALQADALLSELPGKP